MTDAGKLIVVSGPSGAGKSTVIRRVTEGREDVHFSVSMTTRPRSPAETHGVDYLFVSREQFDATADNGGFLEFDRHMGNSYGTPREPVLKAIAEGKKVILDIDVKGAEQVKAAMPEAVTVFITPPDLAELEKRLRGRARDSEEQLKLRLDRAKYEMSKIDGYDVVIINDDAEQASEQFRKVLDAHKQYTKTERK